MKIVYCIESLGFGGGVERVTTCKANYLIALGHQVTILTGDLGTRKPKYEIDPRIQILDLGITYFEDFSYPIWSRFFRTTKKMYLHWRYMKKFLSTHQPDIVVSTHRYETVFLPPLQKKSLKILEFHSSKAMYAKHNSTSTSKRALKKLLYRLYELRDSVCARKFDKVVVLTKEDYELRGGKNNMSIISNPIPFKPKGVSPLNERVVLAIGRFESEKNFASLINIWAKISSKHPDWKLVLVGRGYLYENIKHQIRELGLEHSIELREETSDVISLYKNASIYAMTSKYEGLPMTLIEAQSMGLPIISYACPCGPKDIITHGVNGFLVEPNNEDQFAAYLDTLISDEELRNSMGKQALQASSRYDIKQIMDMWEALFSQATK